VANSRDSSPVNGRLSLFDYSETEFLALICLIDRMQDDFGDILQLD
jgi:hypothetical protein